MKHRISLAAAICAAVLLPLGCANHPEARAPLPSTVGKSQPASIGEPLAEAAPWYSLAARPARRTPKPTPSATPTPAPSATPTPAPSATPASTSIYAPAIDAERLAMAQRVLDLCNQERAAAGVGALVLEGPYPGTPSRMGVATFRSEDMRDRNYFSHTDPEGHSPFWHLTQAGIAYTTAGENIAYGYSTPDAVMSAWMASTGHRANILNANFGRLGVGIALGGTGRYYWTQIFTN